LGNPGDKLAASAVRQGKWKLITNADGAHGLKRNPPAATATPTGHPQLFNLEQDPGETTNLADRHPERVARLTALMADAANTGYTRPGAAKVEIR
jgi:arylsulfatase A